MQWTPEQEDEFLELILDCDSDLEYQRELVHFAAKYGRTARMGLYEGNQLLRRRAVRRSDYEGSTIERVNRTGRSFTWVELRIMSWAFDRKHVESKKEPTPEYISNLLQRSFEEITQEVERQRRTRAGIKGLF